MTREQAVEKIKAAGLSCDTDIARKRIVVAHRDRPQTRSIKYDPTTKEVSESMVGSVIRFFQ